MTKIQAKKEGSVNEHILGNMKRPQEDNEHERRVQLARKYVRQLGPHDNDADEDIDDRKDEFFFDAEDVDRENIQRRLLYDAASKHGQNIFRLLGARLNFDDVELRVIRGFRKSVCGIALTGASERNNNQMGDAEEYLYTVCKEGKIKKFSQRSLRCLKVVQTDPLHHPTCLAVSQMDSPQRSVFVATGGTDRHVCIWNSDNLNLVGKVTETKSMGGGGHALHRSPVTCVNFQLGTNTLFTGSQDRTIKLFNIDNMSYTETLFGHQDSVTCIASLRAEECVSVGARDRVAAARLWKVAEESQVLFTLPGFQRDIVGNVDSVVMLDRSHFVTGDDSGGIALWSRNKKKPTQYLENAHSTAQDSSIIYPITALAAIPYSDFFISGSTGSALNIWKLQADYNTFELAGTIDLGHAGYVNAVSVCLASNSVLIAAAIGKEPRLGRWNIIKNGFNGVVTVRMTLSSE